MVGIWRAAGQPPSWLRLRRMAVCVRVPAGAGKESVSLMAARRPCKGRVCTVPAVSVLRLLRTAFPHGAGPRTGAGERPCRGSRRGRSRSCPAAEEGHGGSIACGPGRRAARAEGGHASGHGRRAPPCRPRAVAAAFRRTGAWRPSRRHRVTRRPGYAGAVTHGPSLSCPRSRPGQRPALPGRPRLQSGSRQSSRAAAAT